MDIREVSVALPAPMIDAARQLAHARDVTFGQIVREALAAELRRAGQPAKTPNRADEQLLGPLRVLLAADFAQARGWSDLQARLTAKGYALREAGGGLALHGHPDGRRLCKASELGHAYRSLMRRFGRPFPGHSHAQIADRVLGPGWRRPETDEGPEDGFDVLEPFE